LVKLLKLAFDALFSFSYVPLRVATFMGVAASLVSFSVGSNALYQKLFTNRAIPGWASMLTATTFLGGAVLLTLGILGEYVARIFDEVRARPPYVVARRMGFPTTDRPPRQQP
jgi:dolichol-phosphate mannosyltransferase